SEERVQMIHEQQEASRSVFEQRSLDRKAFAGRVMRLSPAERAQVDGEKARLDREEKDRRAREEAAATGSEQVEITRGIDEKHPELSLQEAKTSAKMAAKLKALGFEVTEKVGGYGVVGILKNGAGPTVMLRTDMDALPVKEVQEVKCASHETAKDPASGTVVP